MCVAVVVCMVMCSWVMCGWCNCMCSISRIMCTSLCRCIHVCARSVCIMYAYILLGI